CEQAEANRNEAEAVSRGECQRLSEERDRAMQNAQTLAGVRAALAEEVQKLRAEIDRLQNAETVLRQRLDVIEEERTAERQSLSDHRQRVEEVEAVLERERAGHVELEATYKEAQERFAADHGNLMQTLAEAQQQEQSARKQMGELARQLDSLREELDGQ